MKRDLKRFRQRLAWLAGLACVVFVPAPQQSVAQDLGNDQRARLEATEVNFPSQRLGARQRAPANSPEFQQEFQQNSQPQYMQTAAYNPRIAKMSRRLNNVGWELFENRLVDLWGDQLKATAEDEQGSRVRILIPGEDRGIDNHMVIDRLENAVTFEGDPELAENWEAMISLLDTTEDEDSQTIRLVGMGRATPATVRRAVALLGFPEEEGSFAEAVRFAPFKSSSASIAGSPQRRSQLRSIPFRPSSNAKKKKIESAGFGPQRRPPSITPYQPNPPRRIGNRSMGKTTPLPKPATAANANSPTLLKPVTPAPGRVESGMAKSLQPANSTPGLSELPEPGVTSNTFEPATSQAKLKSKPEPTFEPNVQPPARITSVPAGRPRKSVTSNPAAPAQPKANVGMQRRSSSSSTPGVASQPTASREPATIISSKPTPARKITFSVPGKTQEEGDGVQIVEMTDDGLDGPVKIRILPGMNAIALTGNPEDVAKVRRMIEQIVQKAGDSQPVSETYAIKNTDSASLKQNLDTVYEAGYEANNGPVEIVAISNPNSLFVVGQKPAQDIVKELIGKLDTAGPDSDTELDYEIHRLKFISAGDAAARLQGYFRPASDVNGTAAQPVQAGEFIASFEGPVSLVVDHRSNTLFVKGNQRVLSSARRLIRELDIDESQATHVVRFFPCFNASAGSIAEILQEAVNGGFQGAPSVNSPGSQNTGQNNNNNTTGFGGQGATSTRPITALQLATFDENGRTVKSGILLEVRFSADANSNQIMVTGPAKSMDLVEALIKQLDRIPDAETQLKVFTILNGDAQQLLDTMQQIFATDQTQAGGQGLQNQNQQIAQLPLQSASGSEGGSLINMTFAIDQRTNSILASGPAGDLQLVEDLLNRLDEENLSDRINHIYRLSNAPSEDVAAAIQEWLDARDEIFDAGPAGENVFVAARRQVAVIPELVSNALIISATPQYFQEVIRLIEDLDRRPPMVKIKVLIAEVNLNKLSEFGVEVGIQDSLLFDRGLGTIGFPFNSSVIGNGANDTREILAGQGLSNLGIGRTSQDAGYGGLVLSAGNESINILMRALQDRAIARVLSTPDIMTVDNLQGRIQVGQTVSRVTGSNQGNVNNTVSTQVQDVDVGVILEITPRVSPDGMIIMSVDVINSSLGSEADGTAVFANDNGVIRSPPINITQAQTTIMARTGQTVAFTGLIQDRVAEAKRGTPILSDLPFIGPLFSFETKDHTRSELLIVLTPYIVDNDSQLEASNEMSYSRMHWCLDDVATLHGGVAGYDPEFSATAATPTFYPDQDPTGENPQYVPLENGNQNGNRNSSRRDFPQEVFEQPFAEPQAPGQVPYEQAAPDQVNPQGAGQMRNSARRLSGPSRGN